MSYKETLSNKIKRSGRTRNWLAMKLKVDRSTLWRKIDSGSLTTAEKNKINELLK